MRASISSVRRASERAEPTRLAAFLVLVLLLWSPMPASSQANCPGADARTDQGWTAYRSGDMETAEEHFRAVLSDCPGHVGARTGFGYVAMRTGQDENARDAFSTVLDVAPNTIDALVGLGILAWRAGEHSEVRELFERVQALDSGNQDARDYLARLPPELGPPPERPALVRPDTVEYPARINGDFFEVRADEGWVPFYVKGVNLGAALPGRHPSEFPDSATYAQWIDDIAAMGTNTIRVYTIHPPHFYQALEAYNAAHPERPLWLIHGVWTELPPGDDFEDPVWEAEFFAEMHRVVDLLHGRADIAYRPGHASGFYTADVSRWVLAYIIGREWEPYAIVGYNEQHADDRAWEGRYLRVNGGTPADVWMGKASEEIIAYEMDRYNAQRPVAYTNWPTLDPLHHPTETTVDEEVALRRAQGEQVEVAPLEYDNDAVGLDAMLVQATDAYPAGYFASYHAYPYYPDFMILDPDFNRAESSEGPSNYFGYLRDLKEHHAGMAVLISEYGVPTSFGSAHLQPQGWHHGGVTEEEMAHIDARMTREIAEAGMAGGAIFAWIDEWFKKNWLVIDFEIPEDRNRLWLNRLDPEQQYGMVAMEADPPIAGADLAERRGGWSEVEPLYASPGGATLRAAADAAYLWLLYDAGPGSAPDELLIGFDMIDPAAGDFHWPGRVGERLPVGVEFVLRIEADSAQLLVDAPYNPFTIRRVGEMNTTDPAPFPDIDNPLPGLFQGRLQQAYNRPFQTLPNDDGRYEPLRVITNRRRFARDGTEYPAVGYDRGRLPHGPLPDGFWERDDEAGLIEVRIPWMLLNVTDPSSKRVLAEDVTDLAGGFGTEQIEGIGIVAAARAGAEQLQWPGSSAAADVAIFRWDGWEEPRWVGRRRPVFDTMREVFEALDDESLAGGKERP